MDKETLQKLKKDFSELKIAIFNYQKAKKSSKKDEESKIKNLLFLMKKYDLQKYDMHIDLNTFKLDHLKYDIKNIISRIEKELSDKSDD